MSKRQKNDEFEEYLTELEETANRDLVKTPYLLGYPMNVHKIEEVQHRVTSIVHKTHKVLNNVQDPFDNEKSFWKYHSLNQEKFIILKFLKEWLCSSLLIDNAYGLIQPDSTIAILKGVEVGINRFGISNCIVLYSTQAHYCVPKICNYLNVQHGTMKSLKNGNLDIPHLRNQIDILVNSLKIKNFVIVATEGSTFLGSYDAIDEIIYCFKNENIERSNLHFHADLALSGAFYNFFPKKEIKFRLGDQIDSLNISIHKFYGIVFGGIFLLANRSLLAKSKGNSHVSYLNFEDNMVSGSRDGMTAPTLIARLKQLDWREEYNRCIRTTKYTCEKIHEILKIPCFVHYNSITIVMPCPSAKICERYQLATNNQGLCHLVIMPHVDKKLIDTFINELNDQKEEMVNIKKLMIENKWVMNSDFHIFPF